MNYYSRFSTTCKLINCYFLFLAAFYFSCVSLVVNAETIDVNVVNSPEITIDWDDLLNAGANNSPVNNPDDSFDPTINGTTAQNGGISDANSLFGYNPTAPTINTSPGRSPWWVGKFRYFTFQTLNQINTKPGTASKPNVSNLQAGTYTNNGTISTSDYTMYYSSSRISFNWSTLRSDVLGAFFSSDVLNYLNELINVWNNAPTGADFTYTLPDIFGFDTGIEIEVPLYSVANGVGDYSIFSAIFSVIRAFLGVVYYGTVISLIIKSIVYKQ